MADDVGNQEVFLAGAIAIVAEYPPAVGEQLADPRSGTRVLGDYPTLSRLRKACDELAVPIEREAERQAARKSATAGLLPRPKRTAEQQALVDAQVERAKREIAAAATVDPFAPSKDGKTYTTGPPGVAA